VIDFPAVPPLKGIKRPLAVPQTRRSPTYMPETKASFWRSVGRLALFPEIFFPFNVQILTCLTPQEKNSVSVLHPEAVTKA
jgi:hypothetical protein